MEQGTAKISASKKEVGQLFKINFLDISLGLQTKMPFRIKAWEFLVQDKGSVELAGWQYGPHKMLERQRIMSGKNFRSQ
ncbi:hypothetical protein LEMLEM_LOCUS7514 [Lemmus lemmus]